MVLVTLVGEQLAREGEEFIYLGSNSECRNCQLKTVCFNLKPGRNYRITKLRDKYHDCAIHEGKVIVVEVEELPLTVAIPQERSEGTTTTVEKKECKNIGCDAFGICTNTALQNGKTYTIKKVYEKIECPRHHELYKVDVTD
ncbi:MAG TPA: hypothetical protein DSN98_00165 [Thermoplasmata archaeon]|jgi:uncharacterized protein|nr:MAG TPA: hypothetical protein DSN98_00165 [Thermoplasmata archaeon]